MTAISVPLHRGWAARLNAERHATALSVFLLVVVAHWLEHVVQSIQVYVFDKQPPAAKGVLGTAFPWLVTSETLHWGYAAFMVGGLFLLRPGFVGRARQWWNLALGIQVWHFCEHSLLLVQAHTGWHLNGEPVPTSVLQLVVPRLELHLFYNGIVFLPMVVAILLHRYSGAKDRARMHCSCAIARPPGEQPV